MDRLSFHVVTASANGRPVGTWGRWERVALTRLHDATKDVRLWSAHPADGTMSYVTSRVPHLTTVTPTDWTMLRAIARRVLCVADPAPVRHPSVDEYWEVERSAIRLAGYLSSTEMAIQIVVPDRDEDDVEIVLAFDDGLEPIVVPWDELDFVLEPAPRFI